MPRYSFECPSCDAQFTRKLKMGKHPHHACPSCGDSADRVWEGESFGFDFQESATAAPGNSGVSKHDYPTADQAIGRDSEKRWETIRARDEVKEEVRRRGGHRALKRRHGVEGDKAYIEYTSGDDKLIEGRRKLVREAEKAYEGGSS